MGRRFSSDSTCVPERGSANEGSNLPPDIEYDSDNLNDEIGNWKTYPKLQPNTLSKLSRVSRISVAIMQTGRVASWGI